MLRPTARRAFTLVELLVVIAIIAILASLLLPALARAKEKAKAVRVHVELNAVGLALEMYAEDHDGRLPPVRVNCNSDLASHWCQFPIELATEHYLPRGSEPGREANMEDLFNPGHTYKYATPGPQLLNNGPGGNFQLWAPDDLPASVATTGNYYSNPQDVAGALGAVESRPAPGQPTRRRTRMRPLRGRVGIAAPVAAGCSRASPHRTARNTKRHDTYSVSER